jgi:hypothetical protein
VERSERFHEYIRAGDLDNCKRFLMENPGVNRVLDTKNRTAIGAALKNKQFLIFAFLELHNFKSSINTEKYLEQLSEDEEKDFAKAKMIFLRRNEKDYVYDLIYKSSYEKTENEEDAFYTDIIEEAFKGLNEIPIISTIMKIISRGKVSRIHFLFQSNFVNTFDPTLEGDHYGVTDALSNTITIGAKFLTETDSLAKGLSILAHEMAHLAMYTAFKNEGKPYDEGNSEHELRMEVLENGCFDSRTVNEIINDVFTNGYPPHKIINELIVSVPEIETLYRGQKKLGAIKRSFKSLFDFYSVVNGIFQKRLLSLEVKQAAFELNE